MNTQTLRSQTPGRSAGFKGALLALAILFGIHNSAFAQKQEMIVRISEIEVHPQYLEEYKTILKHEAEASVRLEEGVVAIFPMFQRDKPERVRILEIYRNDAAYRAHLKTEHFLKYKSTTLHMVRSLVLVDMDMPDPETAAQMFTKFNLKDDGQ